MWSVILPSIALYPDIILTTMNFIVLVVSCLPFLNVMSREIVSTVGTCLWLNPLIGVPAGARSLSISLRFKKVS